MIIGLCGLAGSGKSSVAKVLVHRYGFTRRPFAFPLKAMVHALGISPDLLDGPSAVKERPLEQFGGKSLRFVLQTLGTEWGRNIIGQDFWVCQWLATKPDVPNIVADDVRFPNEALAIRELDGIIIRVDREGAGSKVGAQHASEDIARITPDFVLVNQGDLDDLKEAVARIIEITTTGGAHDRSSQTAV